VPQGCARSGRLREDRVLERRRHTRVKFRAALPGNIGRTSIYVLDVSESGLGIAHESQLPPPGAVCRVELMSEVGPIRLDCEVVRTVVEAAMLHSGLHVLSTDLQSAARLESLAKTRR
jgi:hypothetical protein